MVLFSSKSRTGSKYVEFRSKLVNKQNLRKYRLSGFSFEVRFPEFRLNQAHAVLSGQYKKELGLSPKDLFPCTLLK